MRKTTYAAGALSLLAALTFATPAQADGWHHDNAPAKLSVLHGVPGLTVDVWVDGNLTLDDFTPGTLAGPLELAAGDYEIAITASDATSADNPVIGPVDVELNDGGDYTAAAPAVDVLAGGTAVIEGLSNPDEAPLKLAAGTVSASVAAAGTTAPVIGPADVTVEAGRNTIVYAWGSLADGTLAVAVQVVDSSDRWCGRHSSRSRERRAPSLITAPGGAAVTGGPAVVTVPSGRQSAPPAASGVPESWPSPPWPPP